MCGACEFARKGKIMGKNILDLRRSRAISLITLIFTTMCLVAGFPAKGADVIDRLCQHILENRKKMILDGGTNQTETIWSDGAILEIGRNFPPALQKLISKPTMYRDIGSTVQQLGSTASDPQWKDAAAAPITQGQRYVKIQSLDHKVSVKVESLYIEYLQQRCPKAQIRVKEERGPAVFIVNGRVRAAIMPVILN